MTPNNSNSNENGNTNTLPPARSFLRPTLRNATLVLPKTGERVRRNFTLRPSSTDSDNRPVDEEDILDSSESLPLIHSANGARRRGARRARGGPRSAADMAKDVGKIIFDACNSRTGRGVLKCSLAYLIACMATFVAPIGGLLGHNDGKHQVATVAVYFHPARSVGSMLEATWLAMGAFLYAAFISFTSMGVSVLFGKQNLLAVGHVLVLLIFCGGGLGLVGWTKQRLANPLVNVACSLTSLAIITVLTKEGAVQDATFSYQKVWQVLKMVLMGVFSSAIVSFLVAPRSARKELREDMVKITDLLEEMLTSITRGFLSGNEHDLNNPLFTKAQNSYKSTFNSLVKNLREARFEHLVVGEEREHEIEVRLVKCIERLAQSLFGLRSAASTQFQLINESLNPMPKDPAACSRHDLLLSPVEQSPTTSPQPIEHNVALWHGLDAITEVSETSTPARTPGEEVERTLTDSQELRTPSRAATGSADIFSLFISQLGPPTKSLAFTLKEVFNELPFGPAPKYEIVFDDNFRRSLDDAKDLFVDARKRALEALYKERVMTRNRSSESAADYEEVAASCGHFSSSLEDFAEDTITYLDILQELKEELQWDTSKRSWNWLKFWRRRSRQEQQAHDDEQRMADAENPNASARSPSPNPWKRSKEQKVAKHRDTGLFSVRIWNVLAPLRRDDIKYAIKVGLGAVLYAMFSFIPATRPFYGHWRGEWGLLSYMLVCSMTIGASNTTGFQRFAGTCFGALLAVLAWIASNDNPFALAFFSWVVSLGCFYIMLGQGRGPLARFIMLTYNLSVLYAYSLSVRDDDNDDDEGGVNPEIWEIVLHRVVSVMTGCLWGIVVTRVIWPISARRKVKDGISLLWLRMGLIWKRDPLQILVDGPSRSTYMDIRESIELQRFLTHLEALRASASHEFDLRGPFPDQGYRKILEGTSRMLGAFHAMQVVISKDLKATPGEAELLRYTREERTSLAARISHLFSVLATSMKLEYPMNDSLPNIEHARDRFLAKLFQYRKQIEGSPNKKATDEDFELLYAYGLVTGQIAAEIEGIGRCIEQVYGVLREDSLRLR